MRQFSNTITLVKNSRGVWDLDTSKGCTCGIKENPKGCYGDCYAAKYSLRYGYYFSKTVLRYFESEKHIHSIIEQINHIDMPFVRIGVTGDPSECWEHTLDVCEVISACNMVLYDMYKKAIVIITKHWHNLTDEQLVRLSGLDVCVNTSISALDKAHLLKNRLVQYNRIKKYCNSVLRIVSCDFNLLKARGRKLDSIQHDLFGNENALDTVLRVEENNKLVTSGLINIRKVKFLGKECYASVYNKTTYLGSCDTCPEMCGIN